MNQKKERVNGMNKKECKNCIWFDQCGEDKACGFYESASDEEQKEIDENEYITDLQERHQAYEEQIEEQNS